MDEKLKKQLEALTKKAKKTWEKVPRLQMAHRCTKL
jgi:hypothetical protein